MSTPPEQGNTVVHPDGYGEGIGAVAPSTVFEVVDAVEPYTPGVGEVGDDTHVVIVAFDEPGLVQQDDGSMVQGKVRRHVSMSLAEYKRLEGNNAG